MRARRLLVASIAVATTAAALPGCSGGSGGGSSSSGNGPVKLTLWQNATTGPGPAFWKTTAAERALCWRAAPPLWMVIPLSLPGVITVGILAFIGSWNGYILPLFILNNPATFTLPLGVQQFSSQYSVDTARVLAFTSLSMLPALIFFSI